MRRAQTWLGVFLVSVPFAFVACGDDEEDGDGGGGSGNRGGTGGDTGGTATGGRTGGTSGTGATGGTTTGGRGGTTTGGTAGTGMGGEGGEDGGQGGEAAVGGEGGEPQGGTGGMMMGGAGGAVAGMGGAVAGGGMGGKAGGGAGGATAGGGAGGATAGGGAGGAAGGGMGGGGGVAPTCDPIPTPPIFVGEFSGGAEVPPITSSGTGVAIAQLNAAETQLTVSAYWSGLTSNTTAGHIHGPANATTGGAGIIFDLGVPVGATSGEVVAWTSAITAGQVTQLKQSLYYANIHSANNTGGEIRAQLVPATTLRTGTLSGAQEVPSVISSGTGRAVAVVFPSGTRASVSVIWAGMTTNTTNAHVHGPAAFGVGPAGILFGLTPPLGMTSGSVTHRIWTFAGTDSANLLGNLTYANVHSTMYTGGELRAQLLPPCP